MEALERKYGELLRSREERARESKKGEYFSGYSQIVLRINLG